MYDKLHKLKEKTQEAMDAVLPITFIVLLLSAVLVPLSTGIVLLFLAGALMLIVGMGLFQLGAELAMIPLGEGIGVHLSKSRKIGTIIFISFIMGVVITIAEPDLQVLANQVPSIPNQTLIWTISLGVGVMLALAVLRVFFKLRLSNLLFILYGILFAVAIFAPADFLPVSFDAGGVTTGPITVPFIMAMGVGLASIRGDKDAEDDSFGFVAICSAGPILAVLLLSIFFNPSDASYTQIAIHDIVTTQDVVKEFIFELPHYAEEVFISLAPVAGVFLLFQMVKKRYNRRELSRMIVGFLYTYLGLVLFLCGVNVGFAPVGSLLGSELALSAWRWLLVPIGMVIGFYIVKAEPAVQVLNRQVEDVTDGTIPGSAMNRALSLGVAVSVGLSMLRILLGIPIYWILVPGYVIALILSRIVPNIFVGIAFDSGGVASGPMTTTFLLPLAMGSCVALGGNVMTDAFGVVALVAMTPLIAVQLMGLVYDLKQRKAQQAAVEDDSDEILDLEEDD